MVRYPKFLIVYISILFLYSCSERDALFPYGGDKMTLYGFVYPDSVSVGITHSQNLNDLVKREFPRVEDAELWLMDDQNRILNRIPHERDGRYRLDTILSVGRGYRIRALHPVFPEALTEVIQLPLPVPEVEVQLVERTEDYYRFRINLEDVGSGADFFLFSGTAFFRNTVIPIGLSIDGDDSFLSQCRIQDIGDILLGDVCFDSGRFTFDVLIEHRGRVFDRIRLEAGAISASFFNYISSVNQSRSDVEKFFFQPNLLRSNVRGGYGVVDGRNMRVVYDE